MQENKQNKPQGKSPFPIMEEEVLDFWDKGKIFEKSVKNQPHPDPLLGKEREIKDYVFYDGPPFATGEPHYGHIVASLMKDSVPRYCTMKGYRVERKWGWDCHGLPIENIAEKDLGVKRKKDIEEMGVEKFNEYCRSKVLGYVDVWKKIIRRMGRWADMENAYKTMDKDYMESIWYVFKELYNKGLIYEGHRSMHICPRCETTLSQSEVAEGYKMIKDLSATVKFELVDESPLPPLDKGGKASNAPFIKGGEGDFKTYILAWTTTPWTLIGNVALAVGEDIDYVKMEVIESKDEKLKEKELYIFSKEYFNKFLPHPAGEEEFAGVSKDIYLLKGYNETKAKITEIKGRDLVDLKYKPLFDYYANDETLENRENGWKIYAGDFVTTEEGTGVVHIAPAFGEDDMKLGKEYNLPFVQHVNMDGTIKAEAGEFAGMDVKNKDDHMKTDVEIIKYLARNGLLFHKEKYEHSYPHCWRCETPLINYATSSWFVDIGKIKMRMLELAQEINWSPAHIKEGRFGMWLMGARDWSISRQRYWASVMPIWKCGGESPLPPLDKGGKAPKAPFSKGGVGELKSCGHLKVIGSIKELEDLSGQKVEDLHKHVVDKITFKCEKCGGEMHRIPDVLDTWFDSGSMPYAQMHYPFENKEKFEANFPAEFIAEGQDQCRAWFYYLHVIATGIKDKHAFKNVIVNGIVLAEDGKKMSKRLKNYPDPSLVMEKYGADAMRMYLLASPVMAAENLNFSEKGVLEALQKNIMILWNVYKFYEMFAGESHIAHRTSHITSESENILDQWIIARLNQLIEEVTKQMEAYDLPRSVRPITEFINDLSTWYIRRSRDRFKSDDEADKNSALATTKHVLTELAKIMAPFTPFIAENLWQKVTGNEFKDEDKSVHLESWPTQLLISNDQLSIISEMELARKIVELGLAKRDEEGIKVRQPLASLKINNQKVLLKDGYLELIKDEVNVKEVLQEQGEGELLVELNLMITEDLKKEGVKRELVRLINSLRKEADMNLDDRAEIFWEVEGEEVESESFVFKVFDAFAEEIMAETLSEGIKYGVEGRGKEATIDGEKVKIAVVKK